jgi:hypothetical protein
LAGFGKNLPNGHSRPRFSTTGSNHIFAITLVDCT